MTIAFLVGAGLGVIVGVVVMALAVAASQADDRMDEAARFMVWADEREQNAKMVLANRQAAASQPHGLAIVRDDFDRKQGGQT